MIFELKPCLIDRDTMTYLFSSFPKIITNYRNGVFEQMEVSIMYSKPNSFRDVQTLYADKASMDITFNGFQISTPTCWNEKYQLLTIDMTKDKFTGRYSLGLNGLFFPDNSLF